MVNTRALTPKHITILKNTQKQNIQQYISIPEYARKLGISRIAVYKKVKKGQIAAVKIGRNYVVPVETKKKIKETITKPYISIPQLAKQLGVSRIAVYKKVKSGQIPAEKMGRNYVISSSKYTRDIPAVISKPLVTVKKFMTIPQLAEQMGKSRIAVYKNVISGSIKAEKVGRNYVIPAQEVFTMPSREEGRTALPSTDYVSMPDLARQIGVNRWSVYRSIKKLQIKTIKVGSSSVILRSEVKKVAGLYSRIEKLDGKKKRSNRKKK